MYFPETSTLSIVLIVNVAHQAAPGIAKASVSDSSVDIDVDVPVPVQVRCRLPIYAIRYRFDTGSLRV